MRRVAVTGCGIISPVGNTPESFFANLMAGKSGIRRMQSDFVDRLEVKIAAQVDFDPSQYFSKQKMASLDRFSQFALVAASQAIADAGLTLQDEDRSMIGIYVGTGAGGATAIEEGYIRLYLEGADRVKPFSVLLIMNNAAASHIALEYNLTGPNLTYSTACSSSTIAIGEAYNQIRLGNSDIMLAGGSEALLTYGNMRAWEALRTLAAEDQNDPGASCKPFSADRSGLVLGEGAGIVVLEEMTRAEARGARIYAEISGYACANDSEHITAPSVEGQAMPMRRALAYAKLQPENIGYINAHGTATRANDVIETAAIKAVFGKHAYSIPVSSTKSMHGHLMGAAGAVEFIATVLVLSNQSLPPTINLKNPDPQCDLDYIPNLGRSGVEIRHAMTNSFAFGGTGGVLIVSKPPSH